VSCSQKTSREPSRQGWRLRASAKGRFIIQTVFRLLLGIAVLPGSHPQRCHVHVGLSSGESDGSTARNVKQLAPRPPVPVWHNNESGR